VARVAPYHSRKFAARLQAASPRATILLRVNPNAGHGMGTSLSDRIVEQADQWAFLFKELGMTYQPVHSVIEQ
jgi:prolyl oligopeptidase